MTDHSQLSAEYDSGMKTIQSYLIGFALSILLTMSAFGVIELQLFSHPCRYVALAILAIAQLFVQSICFLRLNASKQGQWNLLPFLFTILIIAILAGGSLWIMYNLNFNMIN